MKKRAIITKADMVRTIWKSIADNEGAVKKLASKYTCEQLRPLFIDARKRERYGVE